MSIYQSERTVLSYRRCVHMYRPQDMSPRHAAPMLGLTNTAGALAGLVGSACTGCLLRATAHNWALALYAPCIVVYAAGAAVWVLFVDASPRDFDSEAREGARVAREGAREARGRLDRL